MPTRRYTIEQLLFLRASPLVSKPENLPAIEQWLDEAQQQRQGQPEQPARINTRQPSAAVGSAASPMGNFSTGQRPSLLHTRTTGSRSDDVTLGPPKSGFTSSRSITRLTSYHDGMTSNDATGEDIDSPRFRTFGERQHQRKPTEKDLRGEHESWTATRDRRAIESEHSRSESNTERDIKSGKRDDTVRRNGERLDTRWGGKDDLRPNGERAGGWRDRENNRRQWDRNETTEREPEWFDEPISAKQQQIEDEFSAATPRTQEDFEKWKAKMHGKDTTVEVKESAPLPKESVKPRESLKIDSYVETPTLSGFGLRSPEPGNEQGLPKPGASKAKSSRFASMFKKEESPIVEAPPVAELPASNPISLFGSNSADKEGFQRILQMLGQKESPVASPISVAEPRSPTKAAANGTRQRSRYFDATPKSPEESQPPMPFADVAVQTQHGLAPRPQQPPSTSPLPPHMSSSHQRTGTIDGPTEDLSRQGLPEGGTSTPENNVLNLIAGNRTSRQASTNNKDAAFLLGLLQGHSSRPPSQTARPDADFPLWVSPAPEQHAPKPRAPPPPGHIDDHLLRGGLPANDADGRRQVQRGPPGFDEQAMFMHQQQQQQFQQRQGQPPYEPNRRLDAMPPGIQQHMGPAPGGAGLPFMPGPPPGFAHNIRPPQGFPPGMPGMYMGGQPGQSGHRPAPGFPPGMTPTGQPGPPPGFARAMPPHAGPPPGLMMPGGSNQSRQGFEPMYQQRR